MDVRQSGEILGTPGPDVLTGTSGNDRITGFESGDVLTGNGGDDQFVYTSLADGGDFCLEMLSGNQKRLTFSFSQLNRYQESTNEQATAQNCRAHIEYNPSSSLDRVFTCSS